jgi:hypothetical protein
MATDALARFGAAALDAVVSRLSSSDSNVRDAVVVTIELMLGPSNVSRVSDATSKAKLREVLYQVSSDTDPTVSTDGKGANAMFVRLDVNPADVNGDGKVDCSDIAIVMASFGKKIGQSGFDVRADVNGDGIVNVKDLALVSQQLPAGTACQQETP